MIMGGLFLGDGWVKGYSPRWVSSAEDPVGLAREGDAIAPRSGRRSFDGGRGGRGTG